jgi:transcriptional regulator with GAF, ATPase, and Fis domain
MIPEFMAGIYASKAGGMVFAMAAALAALVLAEIAVLALKRQAEAKACAEREAERAREMDEQARSRANNLARILEISNTINANLELEPLLNDIAEAVCQSLGFKMVLLRMLDEETRCFQARAFAGLDEAAIQKLSRSTVPAETFKTWMKE